MKSTIYDVSGSKTIVFALVTFFFVPLFSPINTTPVNISEFQTEPSKDYHISQSYLTTEKNHLDYTNNDNILIFNLLFPSPNITSVSKGQKPIQKITIPGLLNTNNLHQPRLPAKPLRILFPNQKIIKEIQVTSNEQKDLGGGYQLEQGRPLYETIPIPTTINEKNNPWIPRKTDLYSYIGVYNLRGYSICYLNVYPVIYNQKNGELIFHSNVTLKITTTPQFIVKPYPRKSKRYGAHCINCR